MPLTIKAYLDIAVAVGIAALLVFAGWEYDHRKLADARADAVSQQLTVVQQGLQQVQQGVAASDRAIAAMAASQAALGQHATTVRQRVQTMEAKNAQVHDVLSVALPADGCLLDDTCERNAASAPERGVASTVR